MKISVVIPTRNRPESLRKVLQTLHDQTCPPAEIIIVDSSDRAPLSVAENEFAKLPISWIHTIPSVCIQRNIGINRALHDWIFLCDDDLELPPNYLRKLTDHIELHPEAGAVSGTVLQKHKDVWIAQYSLTTLHDLCFRYIFQLSIWGTIHLQKENFLTAYIKTYYNRKGNHISKSGWPIITNFSGEYFKSPVYGIGASVIRKEWLINSPYDEVLDPHGIGDNYGVAIGFPAEGIHILNTVSVYHHEASLNRLNSSLQYYRRVLALDYFIKTKKELRHIKKRWFLWSLLGNLILFIFSRKTEMAKVTMKLLREIIANKNPYVFAKKMGTKITVPQV